jgi:hypothetical protein
MSEIMRVYPGKNTFKPGAILREASYSDTDVSISVLDGCLYVAYKQYCKKEPICINVRYSTTDDEKTLKAQNIELEFVECIQDPRQVDTIWYDSSTLTPIEMAEYYVVDKERSLIMITKFDLYVAIRFSELVLVVSPRTKISSIVSVAGFRGKIDADGIVFDSSVSPDTPMSVCWDARTDRAIAKEYLPSNFVLYKIPSADQKESICWYLHDSRHLNLANSVNPKSSVAGLYYMLEVLYPESSQVSLIEYALGTGKTTAKLCFMDYVPVPKIVRLTQAKLPNITSVVFDVLIREDSSSCEGNVVDRLPLHFKAVVDKYSIPLVFECVKVPDSSVSSLELYHRHTITMDSLGAYTISRMDADAPPDAENYRYVLRVDIAGYHLEIPDVRFEILAPPSIISYPLLVFHRFRKALLILTLEQNRRKLLTFHTPVMYMIKYARIRNELSIALFLALLVW